MEKLKRERGRPQKLEPYKEYIAKAKSAHPDWSAEKVRETLSRALYNLLKEKYPDWSATQISNKVAELLPGLSSVQKYLSKEINPKLKKLGPLEQPWHFGLMSNPKYSISPDAVPFIQIVQDWREKNSDFRGNPPPQKPLTIRQVLWISRIFKAYDQRTLEISLPDWLYLWAEAYANHEIISALSGADPDTTFLDKKMRERIIPIIIVQDESGIDRWPDGSLVDENLLHKKDPLEKAKQIKKDGV